MRLGRVLTFSHYNCFLFSYCLQFQQHNEEHHYARAILRYQGASDTEPVTSRIACTQQQPCKVGIHCYLTETWS